MKTLSTFLFAGGVVVAIAIPLFFGPVVGIVANADEDTSASSLKLDSDSGDSKSDSVDSGDNDDSDDKKSDDADDNDGGFFSGDVVYVREDSPSKKTKADRKEAREKEKLADDVENGADSEGEVVEKDSAYIEVLQAPRAPGVKVFVESQDNLQTAINVWLANRPDIVVDRIDIESYGGGGYLAAVSYNVSDLVGKKTQLKIIVGEDAEVKAQEFLDTFGETRAVSFIDITTGSSSDFETSVTAPMLFIVYEELI
jgi:hypothetical protein